MLNAVTKTAIGIAKKQTPKLFSVAKDAKIGTEITNTLSGTRYFRSADVGKTIGNVVHGYATVIEKSGHYSSIPTSAFDKLLKFVETMNPSKSLKQVIFAGDGVRPATLVKAENIDKFLTGILA